MKKPNTTKHVILGIAAACLLLAFLPYFYTGESETTNESPGEEGPKTAPTEEEPNRQEESTVDSDPTKTPTTTTEFEVDDPFLLAHTLDPTNALDANYPLWTSVEWLQWLETRDKLQQKAKEKRSRSKKSRARSRSLKKKKRNTVVIGTPGEIFRAFSPDSLKYHTNDHEITWSSKPLPTYIFSQGNEIYFCDLAFISVELRDGRPFHLEATAKDLLSSWDDPEYAFDFRAECEVVK